MTFLCFQGTGFFLVVWLKLKNMTFTLPLMNESSALYQKTQDDVINEVRNNGQCYHTFEKPKGANIVAGILQS